MDHGRHAGADVMSETLPLRPPDIEKAMMHLSAAAVEAEFGMKASSWKAGEAPDRAWWAYRSALRSIERAERELDDVARGRV